MQKSSLMFFIIISILAMIAASEAFTTPNSGTAMIRFFGLASFFLICISLILGPLAVLWPKTFGILIEPRRSIGLCGFVFALLHYILVLVIYFNSDPSTIPPLLQLQIAFPAFFLLLILALTSSDYAMSKLGPWWKKIQRLNYIIFALSFIHFIMEVNSTHPGNMSYSEIFSVLVGIIAVILQICSFYYRIRNIPKPQ